LQAQRLAAKGVPTPVMQKNNKQTVCQTEYTIHPPLEHRFARQHLSYINLKINNVLS
jgi:hypothetical protein